MKANVPASIVKRIAALPKYRFPALEINHSANLTSLPQASGYGVYIQREWQITVIEK